MQGLLYLGKYSILFGVHIMQHLLMLLSPSCYSSILQQDIPLNNPVL